MTNLFVLDFFLSSSDIINTPIPRNGLKLPNDAGKVALESPQIKLLPSILKRFEDRCKVRNELALDSFNTEFTGLAHFDIYIWPIFK